MTMHLARGLTTLNTKKRKPKKRKDPSFYEEGWRKHNKFLKNAKMDTMTLSEYIDYVHGKFTSKTRTSVVSTPWHHTDSNYHRESPNIPSASTHRSFGPATRRTPMQYTGERRLIGIATMHNRIWFQFSQMMKKISQDVRRLRKLPQCVGTNFWQNYH